MFLFALILAEYRYCIYRTTAEGCQADLDQQKETEMSITYQENSDYFFYLPENLTITFDLGLFHNSNLVFEGTQDRNVVVQLNSPSIVTTTMKALTFRNLLVYYNELRAQELIMDNSVFLSQNTQNVITISGTITLQRSYCNDTYIEAATSVTFNWDTDTASSSVIKIVSPVFYLNGITKDYRYVQRGNELDIYEGTTLIQTFSLLGYDKSRKTDFYIDTPNSLTFGSIYSNAECAFQNVFITQSNDITIESADWSTYERFNFRINGTVKLNKYITAGVKFAPTVSSQDRGESEGKDKAIMSALQTIPIIGMDEGTRTLGFSQFRKDDVNPYERLRQVTDSRDIKNFDVASWVDALKI